MNSRQIKDMRVMLAAQTARAEIRRPSPLTGALLRLMPRRPRPPEPANVEAASLEQGQADAAPFAEDGDDEHDAPLLMDAAPVPSPVPPGLLMGDLAPWRPAFGQRRETVLDLRDPAPAEPRRLTLLAESGEAVGEMVQREGADEALEPVQAHRRRLVEASHAAETPYFPEDLQDEPKRSARTAEPAASATCGAQAAFLLAGLAARLASEAAGLERLRASTP